MSSAPLSLVQASLPTAEAREASPSLVERLGRIESIDVQLALRSVSGQLPLLGRVVKRFADVYGAGMPELSEGGNGTADRRSQWLDACHSMRGSLPTVGAARLLDAFVDFERRLKLDAPVDAVLNGVAAALQGELIALARALASASAGTAAPAELRVELSA